LLPLGIIFFDAVFCMLLYSMRSTKYQKIFPPPHSGLGWARVRH
jgi:hypothetical protein